jgi:hypothetical protein
MFSAVGLFFWFGVLLLLESPDHVNPKDDMYLKQVKKEKSGKYGIPSIQIAK